MVGELPKGGLAAYRDDGDYLMLALAGKLVRGEKYAELVEAAFVEAQQADASAEELLVDDGREAVEVEHHPNSIR